MQRNLVELALGDSGDDDSQAKFISIRKCRGVPEVVNSSVEVVDTRMVLALVASRERSMAIHSQRCSPPP